MPLHGGLADGPGNILAVYQHVTLAAVGLPWRRHLDGDAGGQRLEGGAVAQVEAGPHGRQGEGAVHHARVEIEVAEARREHGAQRALPGPCRAVDGDNRGLLHDVLVGAG
jgi:hypothetical protein